ncbi:MAG TPA: cupin domain-containing protein [Burkholderiales bacterium]
MKPIIRVYSYINSRWMTIAARIAILTAAVLAGYALAQGTAPKENKGIKVDTLGVMDLAGEVASVDGLKLRLNRLTVQPGGMSAFHSHKDRPEIVYVVQGSYISHAEGKPDEVLRTGDVVTGGKNRNHWIENVGSEPAVAMLFVLSK